jgi:hypothetical protein
MPIGFEHNAGGAQRFQSKNRTSADRQQPQVRRDALYVGAEIKARLKIQ